MIYLLSKFTVNMAGVYVCDTAFKSLTHQTSVHHGRLLFLVCADPLAPSESHTSVRAPSGGVGSQASSQLWPGFLAQITQGKCVGESRSQLWNSTAASCLEPGCQGHRAAQAGIRELQEAILASSLSPRGLPSNQLLGRQKAKLQPLLVLDSVPDILRVK